MTMTPARTSDTTDPTRRQFIRSAAAAGVGLGAGGAAVAAVAAAQLQPEQPDSAPRTATDKPVRPVVIASANGLKALDAAYKALAAGEDPLEAAIRTVTIVEDDPNDQSVGLGGLPNEDGVVELDASVMHGPTHNAGAVASLRNIRNPAQVARLVMQRTDHVLLVGEGALRFARAHGFREEDLLTEASRKAWLKWKTDRDRRDNWLPEDDREPGPGARGPLAPRQSDAELARYDAARIAPAGDLVFTWGTIHCSAVDAHGNIGGATTTSGLSYKIPGRVGDSPILGAGLYVDNEVGAAGSTGRGEANLLNCTSFFVVERMRAGLSPQEACLEALKRIADRNEPRLRRPDGRPNFGLAIYAVTKDGRHGAATMFSGGKYAVQDAAGARLEPCAFLYPKP